jgi:hypothetical protein
VSIGTLDLRRAASLLATTGQATKDAQANQALFNTEKTASVHIRHLLAKVKSPVAAKRPPSPTGSTSTGHDPPPPWFLPARTLR